MDTERVLRQLRRVVNQLLFVKKKRMFTFGGVDFYPSEVHLMLVLQDRLATNATRIAAELGVTKGAVSQSLTRLEQKGVLEKFRDPKNKNELTLTFTSFGRQALDHYRETTRGIFDETRAMLDRFTEAERRTVEVFLEEVAKALDGIPG